MWRFASLGQLITDSHVCRKGNKYISIACSRTLLFERLDHPKPKLITLSPYMLRTAAFLAQNKDHCHKVSCRENSEKNDGVSFFSEANFGCLSTMPLVCCLK